MFVKTPTLNKTFILLYFIQFPVELETLFSKSSIESHVFFKECSLSGYDQHSQQLFPPSITTIYNPLY
jgi:hypothetical protein